MVLNIYILLLEGNRYYIGNSGYFIKAYQQHIDKKGCEWTKIHRVVNILKVITETNEYTLDDCVIEYMKKYGVDNVRGGSFEDVVLSPAQLEKLSNYL